MNVIEDHISLARSAYFTPQAFQRRRAYFPFFVADGRPFKQQPFRQPCFASAATDPETWSHLTSLLLAPRAFESVPYCTGRARNAPTDVGDDDLGVPMESKILREENRHERDRRSHFTCAERKFHAAGISRAAGVYHSSVAGIGDKKRDTRSSVSLDPGSCLSSRAVSSQVLSVYVRLTSVFGMGTGGTAQLNHRKGVVAKQLENCIS